MRAMNYTLSVLLPLLALACEDPKPLPLPPGVEGSGVNNAIDGGEDICLEHEDYFAQRLWPLLASRCAK